MKKIIINSYACCPGKGSEKGMGWNWVTHIARFCEVHVICESEFRHIVEQWIEDHRNDAEYSGIIQNMHFYWNTIGGDNNPLKTEKIRKMCWNQGDWRFYFYYRIWQRKTYRIAQDIIAHESTKTDADGNIHGIDLLHQLNMIGFREPGYFWKISRKTGIPFIWGPIGGMKLFPLVYGGSKKMLLFFKVKNLITKLQICFQPNVRKAIKTASCIISAIRNSHDALKKNYGIHTIIINETGCSAITTPLTEEELNAREHTESLEVIWVGKFDFRKRLDIALNAVKMANVFCTDKPRIHLTVYGSGTKRQTDFAHDLCKIYGIEKWVTFMGQQDEEHVKAAMRQSNVMLFTSINEDTSTVIMEAISQQLPVVCFDCCGMANVIDESVGRKIALSNPDLSADQFADTLLYFHENRDELRKRAINCVEHSHKFSWDSKMDTLMSIYDKAIESQKQKH